MERLDKEWMDVSEKDIMRMMNDTSQLTANHAARQLSLAATAAQKSNALTNNVEFYKWMARNYGGSGIFDTSLTMQNYVAQGAGTEGWMAKQLQGKGYEWDWMAAQRADPRNLFRSYDAGDVANRIASDVTEKNILTGSSSEYQMKAYTSKTNPHLKNTPKDMTVVTNKEKVGTVKANGYKNVKEFQDAETIRQSTHDRLKQVKDGKAYTSYNVENVAGTMAKSGLIGFAIGIGTEAVISYKSWKSGNITDEEYLTEILKAGGDAAVTAAMTSGIMIPVSAVITASGLAAPITIPIAFVVGAAVNKLVAPCFGRGEYKAILSEAKYYQNIEDVYDDLIGSMECASHEYYDFVVCAAKHNEEYSEMKQRSMEINQDLNSLYDSI